MTQEDKELLLKDLCARLPYGVKATTKSGCWPDVYNIEGYKNDRIYLDCPCYDEGDDEWLVESVVPYLRPMSSMTEEECITLSKLIPSVTDAWKYIKTPIPLYIANLAQFNFFHSHHLDWRGLISKGLAIEAPEGIYND